MATKYNRKTILPGIEGAQPEVPAALPPDLQREFDAFLKSRAPAVIIPPAPVQETTIVVKPSDIPHDVVLEAAQVIKQAETVLAPLMAQQAPAPKTEPIVVRQKFKADIVVQAPVGVTITEDWEKALVAKATEAASHESVKVQRLVHKAGQWSVDGRPVEGNKIRLAVLSYSASKALFPGSYNDQQPGSPTCFATGPDEKTLVPSPASPKREAESCAVCPHNRWGSDPSGRGGKRCKDSRRVLAVVEVDDPESIAAAEVRQFSVPRGSVTEWGNYVSACKAHSPFNVLGVLTEVGIATKGGAYGLTFKPVGVLEKAQVRALQARASEFASALYEAPVGDEAPAPSQKF
jgi:hypothetical protein